MTRAALLIAAAALIAGCADQPAMTEANAELQIRGAAAAENRGLAAARAATARFHRFDVAEAAGYDFLFLGICMDQPGVGGMGYHYVDTLLLDGTLDVAAPEAVLYEDGPDGTLQLVGLEYVIPAGAWTSSDPPVLLGQELALNGFGLWALHVWIWKRNPAGMYQDWNPNVSCEDGPQAGVRHH